MESLDSIFTFRKRHMKVAKESKTKVTMLENLKHQFPLIGTGSRTEEIACQDGLDSSISDADQLVVIMKLNEQEVKTCVKIIPENPAFAWIDVTNKHLSQQMYGKKCIVLNKDGKMYLDASKVKHLESIQELTENEKTVLVERNIFQEKQTTPNITLKAKSIKDCLTQLYGEVMTNKEEVRGKSNEVYSVQDIAENMMVLPDNDIVPAIGCHGWPNIAAGSLKRIEKRYGANLAEQIKSYGHHYVAKTRVDGEPDLDWRVSFSVAEWAIVDQWSDTQRMCHIFLKTMLKEHVDTPKGIVTTYHLKTLMLWEVETKPKEFWSQKYICKCVLVILQDLIHAVVSKDLPHYFIDFLNLFGTTNSCHLNQAALQLNWLWKNPDLIIPDKRNMKILVDQEGFKQWFINGEKVIKFPATNADHYWNARSMSETAANVAVLTLYEYSLENISKHHMRERKMLLNAFICVVQNIFTSVQLQEKEIYKDSVENIFGASQITQTMKNRALLRSVERQLKQANVFKNLMMLKFKMTPLMDKKSSTTAQRMNDKQLFDFYLTNLTNTPGHEDICVELCEHGSDILNFLSIDDMANATTSFFHF